MVTFCTLFSGSSGNAIYIASKDTRLLIDCGVSGKKVAASLKDIGVDPKNLDAILVTHEHGDHVQGVGIMSRRYGIDVYANKGTWKEMRNIIGEIDDANVKNIDKEKEFYINDILIKSFSISHDAVEPVGYSIVAEGKKITIATDMGYVSREVVKHFEGSDMMLIESNHDENMLMCGRYPYFLKKRILSKLGHLSNELAGKLAAHMYEKGTKKFLLGHLSKENNFPDLAYQTVYNTLKSKNIDVDRDVVLNMANRDKTSSIFNL
jgi:phosphoribosyl 1,2-cyclic phosphodiesterase